MNFDNHNMIKQKIFMYDKNKKSWMTVIIHRKKYSE